MIKITGGGYDPEIFAPFFIRLLIKDRLIVESKVRIIENDPALYCTFVNLA